MSEDWCPETSDPAMDALMLAVSGLQAGSHEQVRNCLAPIVEYLNTAAEAAADQARRKPKRAQEIALREFRIATTALLAEQTLTAAALLRALQDLTGLDAAVVINATTRQQTLHCKHEVNHV